MRKVLSFIFLCVLGCKACCQDIDQITNPPITIPLKTINGDSSWFKQNIYLFAVDNPTDYKYPTGYKNFRVANIVLNWAQEKFEDLHKGKMSADEFRKQAKLYYIDTTVLYKGDLKGNSINVFTAIDSVNKYVIVDANNNNSFLDDKLYVFPLKDRNPEKPKLSVLVTKYNGKEITTFLAPVSIDPFDYQYGKTELEKSLEISLTAGSMRLGQIELNGAIYQIGLSGKNFGLESSNNADYLLHVRKLPLNENDNNNYYYQSYYSLDIGGSLYSIRQVTDSSMTIEFIKKANGGGGRLYATAPGFEIPDVITNKPFKLDLHSEKYTIIDFWGSWCGPCIESLPVLIAAHNQFSNKVNFVSIALDYDKDIEKLKGLIGKYKLTWPQLWVNRHEIENSPIFDYKVDAYPTTILIDTSGKIIYHGVGPEGLQGVITLLQNLPTKNNN